MPGRLVADLKAGYFDRFFKNDLTQMRPLSRWLNFWFARPVKMSQKRSGTDGQKVIS